MPDDTTLNVGDTVCFNSGGHLMTILSIEDEAATCVWSVRGDVKSKSFPTKTLRKSDGTPPVITLDFGRKLPSGNSE